MLCCCWWWCCCWWLGYRKFSQSMKTSASKRFGIVVNISGQWRKLMHWIIGASAVFSIFTGRIWSLMMWFGLVRISHSCQIILVDGTCLSLATFVVPTPVKTILELFTPRQTWLRRVEDNLCPLNFGLAMARQCTLDRSTWCQLMEAATSSWHAPERKSTAQSTLCIQWVLPSPLNVLRVRMTVDWGNWQIQIYMKNGHKNGACILCYWDWCGVLSWWYGLEHVRICWTNIMKIY